MIRRTLLSTLVAAALLAGCTKSPVQAPAAQPDTAPQAAFAQPVSQWAEVAPHVYLRYQRIGQGESTVVLLHKHSSALENWDEVLPYLVSDNRSVIRFDTRGAGLSTKVRHAITMDELVEDLRGLLDKLQVNGSVVLVGDTIGGSIALKFAATYPERTAGVIALGPTSYLEPQPDRLIKFADPLTPEALSAPVPPRPDAAALDAAQKSREKQQDAVYPRALRVSPERFARFEGVERSVDPTSSALVMRANYAIGFADVFAKVRAPVIVTAGVSSPRSMESFRELAAAIPGAKLVELQTGHFASVQSPELVGPLVQQFLTDLNR